MNTTPDSNGKFLLLAFFDPCVQVVFCPNTIVMTVDNTLLNTGCITCVEHNNGELTFNTALNEPLRIPVIWGSPIVTSHIVTSIICLHVRLRKEWESGEGRFSKESVKFFKLI
jgi:hypothetical protein